MNVRFLCAISHPPYLLLVDLAGRTEEPPSRATVGPSFFPRVASTGWVAYLTRGRPEAGMGWLSSLAVTTPQLETIDLLPRAASFAPPSWMPDGKSFLFVRTQPGSALREVVAYQVETGEEAILFRGEGLRSVAFLETDHVTYSTQSAIYRRSASSGQTDTLFESQVGAWFASFGTDDVFLTLDQLAPSPLGPVALVARWARQGRASHEEVMVLEDDQLTRILPGKVARSPRWFGNSLAMATDGGIELVKSGKRLRKVPVRQLHSFDLMA
jgi:hypothetical protein